MTKTQERKVIKLIEKFDFEVVRNAMLLKEWTWGRGNTPTINEMKHHVRELFIRFFDRPDCSGYGSGGFVIEQNGGFIELTFTLESQYL